MRVYRTSSGRRASRAACLGFILVALPVATSSMAQPGDREAGVDRGPGTIPKPVADAPISLTADRVRHWDEDGTRCVLLEDHAAVFRGDDGIRADRAVVRIVSVRDDSTGVTHRVEVYAEGKARRTDDNSPPRPRLRESWATRGEIKLSAGSDQNLVSLAQAPPGLAVLARAAANPEGPRTDGAAVPKAAPAAIADAGDSTGMPPLPASPAGDASALPAMPADRGDKATEADAVEPSRAEDDRPVRLRDPSYRQVQFVDGPGFPSGPGARPTTPAPTTPPIEPDGPPDDFGPSLAPPVVDGPGFVPTPPGSRPGQAPSTDLDALPGVPPGRESPRPAAPPRPPEVAPLLPGTARVTSIYGKSGPNFQIQSIGESSDGTQIIQIVGGVNVVTEAPNLGIVDLEADSAIIWRKPKPDGPSPRVGPDGEVIDKADDPMEIYLEGHVVFRQDRRVLQGRDDQTTVHAERAFYDYRADRYLALDAQVDVFSPGLVAPFKMKTPRVDGFHPLVPGPGGQMLPSTFKEIRAQQTTSTGSRFPTPGYRFNSRTVDVFQVLSDNVPPNDGGDAADDQRRTTWRIDARRNVFYMGQVPVFYWPRFVTDVDDLDPPLRQISFRTNNYFGQQALLDFNGFKLLGLRRPGWIDTWNVDVDYLSARKAVAVGSEIGWFGKDPVRDLLDPYHKDRNFTPSVFTDYAGYFDLWGLRDRGRDVLGPGPAIVTRNVLVPVGNKQFLVAGRAGFQRISVPSFQDFRGRLNFRHMQSFLTPDSDPYEDARVNLEVGFISDRYFLEQYYKRLFDIGLDHETLIYGIRQRENWAATVLAEVNPNNFNTETQWLPRLDYYRLGDSLLGDHFTYFQHSGVDWANTHTANDVNNKNIFAYIPYDPVSNTSRTLKTGRASTAHELDLPLNFGSLRIVPYVQGQAVAWNQQIAGSSVGRVFGAAGARAEVMAWRAYPNAENEMFNVHGLNHKISFQADFRDAYSNVNLNSIGVQDDLDDNSYEQVRRFFALTNYAGGVLPPQYDPRFLILRRGLSPITGTTDVQASIETIRFGIHQRLQTKRGPEGKRRIIDYAVLDLESTYFPQASRDNFGKPFGQNTYNFEWYVGDRTSFVSYGWFEFFNITGNDLNKVIPRSRTNPFGLDIITTGFNFNRPPRGNLFVGYSVIDTGPIQTSALNLNYSYWMSPKWFATVATSYDFANKILLGSNASVTRIGKDYFVSVGLQANPLQHSYMFVFDVIPRLSPSLHLGSGTGLTRLDTRYAPVQ